MSRQENPLLNGDNSDGENVETSDGIKLDKLKKHFESKTAWWGYVGLLTALMLALIYIGMVIISSTNSFLSSYGYALWKIGAITSLLAVGVLSAPFIAKMSEIPAGVRIMGIGSCVFVGVDLAASIFFKIKECITWSNCNTSGFASDLVQTGLGLTASSAALCAPDLFAWFQVMFWVGLFEFFVKLLALVAVIRLTLSIDDLSKLLMKIQQHMIKIGDLLHKKTEKMLKGDSIKQGISPDFLELSVDEMRKSHYADYQSEDECD